MNQELIPQWGRDEASQILTYYMMYKGLETEDFICAFEHSVEPVRLDDPILWNALQGMLEDAEALTNPQEDLAWTYGIMERLCEYFEKPVPKMQDIPLRVQDNLSIGELFDRLDVLQRDPDSAHYFAALDKQTMKKRLRLVVSNDTEPAGGDD